MEWAKRCLAHVAWKFAPSLDHGDLQIDCTSSLRLMSESDSFKHRISARGSSLLANRKVPDGHRDAGSDRRLARYEPFAVVAMFTFSASFGLQQLTSLVHWLWLICESQAICGDQPSSSAKCSRRPGTNRLFHARLAVEERTGPWPQH